MAWSDAARRASAEIRRQRAKGSYKPSTAAKQRLGESMEKRVARMIRARLHYGNAPLDLSLRSAGRTQGIEVKTFVDNSNQKITMHPESLARKLSWGRQQKARLHTVLVDARGKLRQIFYRQGVGSFRLRSMTRVSSAAHLRSLIRG